MNFNLKNIPKRNNKPREKGITMVIDMTFGYYFLQELLFLEINSKPLILKEDM